MKYSTEWTSNSLNTAFWQEVLVGRTIVALDFDDKGLKSLKLDSGETVYTPTDVHPLYIVQDLQCNYAQESVTSK